LIDLSTNTNEILNNDNLIFDLKSDCIYKKVFLNESNKSYLNLLISLILNINYKDLCNNSYLSNNEIPANNKRSSFADLILKYRNKNIIIEMNKNKTNAIIEKNNLYLLKQHTLRSNNKNKYGKYNDTILINIDNYDILGKNKLIYKAEFIYYDYNIHLYKNIKTININLDYIRNKYYNKNKLTRLEKLLILFIEQKKDKIREIIKIPETEGVLKFMDRLKFEDYNGIVIYDHEEFKKMENEEKEKKHKNTEKRLKKKEEQLIKSEQELKKNEQELKKNEEELKNKEIIMRNKIKNITSEMKKHNLPLELIEKITNI